MLHHLCQYHPWRHVNTLRSRPRSGWLFVNVVIIAQRQRLHPPCFASNRSFTSTRLIPLWPNVWFWASFSPDYFVANHIVLLWLQYPRDGAAPWRFKSSFELDSSSSNQSKRKRALWPKFRWDDASWAITATGTNATAKEHVCTSFRLTSDRWTNVISCCRVYLSR